MLRIFALPFAIAKKALLNSKTVATLFTGSLSGSTHNHRFAQLLVAISGMMLLLDWFFSVPLVSSFCQYRYLFIIFFPILNFLHLCRSYSFACALVFDFLSTENSWVYLFLGADNASLGVSSTFASLPLQVLPVPFILCILLLISRIITERLHTYF